MELMEKRRKHFAALRAQEKRNKPPTKAQKRSPKSTYLKHMGGYKHKQLMGKSYDEIQKLFDKEMKRVNTFVDMSLEAQESNEKKVEEKNWDDKETDEHEEVKADETAELKNHLVIKKDDDIAIDAIPLATKPPVIVDYKLLKEGIMGIDREDLQTLWKLVKTKHGDLRPEDEHERVLWGDLKVMFEPNIRSDVWRNLQGYKMCLSTAQAIIVNKKCHKRFDNVYPPKQAVDTKVTIPGVERPWLSKAEGFILPNHDTGRILPSESQRNTTDPSVAVTDSSATDYDSADESSVCSTPLPPLKKLDGAEPISGPKTIKSILRSKSTFKAEALKSVIINEPSSAPAKGNKSSSASKVHSAPAGKLKSVKIEDDPPLAIVMKELNNLKLQFSKNQSSHSRNDQSQHTPQNKYKTQFKKSCELCGLNNHLTENCYKVLFCKKCERTDHRTCDHAEYISTMNMSQHLKSLGRMSSRPNIPRPSKRFFPPCIHYGGIDHLSNECLYYPICKALQAKKVEALKSTRAESSNANRSKTPTKRYLHKYVEQPGPKVVFGDDSTFTTEGYGSIKCNGIVFTKFDEKRGTIFNSNKEIVMIAPRVRDVYVLDMTSSAQESCFFAKASKNLNWLWHKRLAHLNFKTINKLAKKNLVIGLPLLTSSIKKCLHLLHMDLFGPVTPTSINHEKYTLVIVDEYSRYTWAYFLKKKSKAPETIMSFIKRVENQNDIKVKQLRTDNGRTVKLHNDILMFQQHHGESLSEAWTRFKDLLQKVPHHGIDLWLQVQNCFDHVNPVTRRNHDQSPGGKLCDLNAKESWALLEDLALYDNKSWNDPRDFAKSVKAISLP
ncbi:retrovirus-related pol polyprotein from transposon TNT 1-94 [Tanacetum coccineum]